MSPFVPAACYGNSSSYALNNHKGRYIFHLGVPWRVPTRSGHAGVFCWLIKTFFPPYCTNWYSIRLGGIRPICLSADLCKPCICQESSLNDNLGCRVPSLFIFYLFPGIQDSYYKRGRGSLEKENIYRMSFLGRKLQNIVLSWADLLCCLSKIIKLHL